VFQVRDPVVASFVFCRAMRRVVAPAMPVVPAVAAPTGSTPFFRLRAGTPARSPAAPAAPRARPAPEAPFLGCGAKAGATPAAPEAPPKAALETALETAPETGTEAGTEAGRAEAASEAPAKRTSASAPVAEEEGPGEERRMHGTPPPGERPPAPAVFVLVVVVMTMLVTVVFVMTMLVLVVVVMTVRFPPDLLVSLAAPRAAPSLCFEIVVIIFS
jgi:hypothetical protein